MVISNCPARNILQSEKPYFIDLGALINIFQILTLLYEGGVKKVKHADLALVKVVDDGVVESFFELPLGLGAVGLKLGIARLI